MPSFEVSQDSRIVKAMNDACRKVRGRDQPTGAITPPGHCGTDAAHFYREAWKASLARPGGRYNAMPDKRVVIGDDLDMVRIYLWSCSTGEVV